MRSASASRSAASTGKLQWGFGVDREIVLDLHDFVCAMEEAFAELWETAGVAGAEDEAERSEARERGSFRRLFIADRRGTGPGRRPGAGPCAWRARTDGIPGERVSAGPTESRPEPLRVPGGREKARSPASPGATIVPSFG
jgi:hypothetical protein